MFETIIEMVNGQFYLIVLCDIMLQQQLGNGELFQIPSLVRYSVIDMVRESS
jgi:hypothetical protein